MRNKLMCPVCLLLLAIPAIPLFGQLPAGWTSLDIGGPAAAGSAHHDENTKTWTIQGDGAGIRSQADQVQFVYRPLSGDGELAARIVSIDPPLSDWSMAGVMIRVMLVPGSPFIFMGLSAGTETRDPRITLWGRSAFDAVAEDETTGPVTAPYWVKIRRSGNTFSGHFSPDGKEWTEWYNTTVAGIPRDIYIGYAVTSDVNGKLVTAVFDQGPVTAADPDPGNSATDVPQDTILSWAPGETAVSRDVYLGASLADVQAAGRADPRGVLVSQGQTATTFDPGLLEYGTTYYWRIDEVNAPPDSTIFKGNIWRFETEPYAYPLTDIIATASSFDPDMPPERTVDGSGLDPLGRHWTTSKDMWLTSEDEELPAWIQFEFPGVRRLQQIKVWNFNERFEHVVGVGARDVLIEYSLDGEQWTTLKDAVIPQAPGSDTYAGTEPIDLESIEARFVRLVIETNWGGHAQSGLSEVQFLHAPMQAREPQPADEAVGVAIGTDLTWRPGREAELHEVYFGADADAVAAGTVPVSSQTQRIYTPPTLDLATTYFWRVDQVGELGAYAGELWSFTAQEFLIIDDFESYDDTDNPIFYAWIDGYEDDSNGSQVGHDDAADGTFGERNIVRNGSQSMPLYYKNTGAATLSEAVLSLPSDLRNWTASGIKSLSLHFHGAAGNNGQLYVKIGNTKVVYDGDAADIKRAAWQAWNIDLSQVGSNLSNVATLAIGIQGAGATGVVYIDDIRLYPHSLQYITPVEPGTANLVAHYAFEGNVNDGSGKGRHGTVQGNVTYVAGVTGQAIKLDGVGAHVTVAGVGISGAASRTISGWAKADRLTIPAWTNVFGFTGPSAADQHFDIQAVGTTGTTTLGYYGLHRHNWERDILPIDLEWRHLAATFDGTTVTWYGDGLAIGSAEVANVNTPGAFRVGKRQDNNNHFPGSVDEVRVYDRALSAEEIAWLAGMRAPRHKPF